MCTTGKKLTLFGQQRQSPVEAGEIPSISPLVHQPVPPSSLSQAQGGPSQALAMPPVAKSRPWEVQARPWEARARPRELSQAKEGQTRPRKAPARPWRL